MPETEGRKSLLESEWSGVWWLWILEAVVVKKGEELRGLITENEGEDEEEELGKEEAMEMVSLELWLIATAMDVME